MSKNNKEVIINFRLTKQLNAWLSAEADRNHRTKSGQLLHIISDMAKLPQTENNAI